MRPGGQRSIEATVLGSKALLMTTYGMMESMIPGASSGVDERHTGIPALLPVSERLGNLACSISFSYLGGELFCRDGRGWDGTERNGRPFLKSRSNGYDSNQSVTEEHSASMDGKGMHMRVPR